MIQGIIWSVFSTPDWAVLISSLWSLSPQFKSHSNQEVTRLLPLALKTSIDKFWVKDGSKRPEEWQWQKTRAKSCSLCTLEPAICYGAQQSQQADTSAATETNHQKTCQGPFQGKSNKYWKRWFTLHTVLSEMLPEAFLHSLSLTAYHTLLSLFPLCRPVLTQLMVG